MLQGFQSMTQACGMLEMSDSRDAYLTSLCAHTLTDTASSDHSHLSRAEGVTSPIGMLHASLRHRSSMQGRPGSNQMRTISLMDTSVI